MTVTDREELIRQTAFLCYYFHWTEEAVTELPHIARKRYCEEISRINRQINGEGNNPFTV